MFMSNALCLDMCSLLKSFMYLLIRSNEAWESVAISKAVFVAIWLAMAAWMASKRPDRTTVQRACSLITGLSGSEYPTIYRHAVYVNQQNNSIYTERPCC
jgi:hypothetical protein